ncbi:unnamed protein product [Lymnaea stagnalis]|uniref:B30.2/SPRY domain-containing protein n=1 Tax=Lymnaea stagnalis TaxID=6523 RepID=A0AAV2IAK6_LYMST
MRLASFPCRGAVRDLHQGAQIKLLIGSSSPDQVFSSTKMGSGDTRVVLDDYNSDLNIIIAKNGYSASTLNSPRGFRLLWGGVRATHGVCRGKVFFEVRVTEHLDPGIGEGFSEPHPNMVRVGWSADSPLFTLGESQRSYGYGGAGKSSHDSRFQDYGEPFGHGDVIGAMLDLDSNPGSISFTKNGRFLGIAFAVRDVRRGDRTAALFPHIACKNAMFKTNFGQEAPWSRLPAGYTFIGNMAPKDRVRGLAPPALRSSCEMIMVIGLPGCGKTTWSHQKQTDHPGKRYNILGTDILIDQIRLMGVSRYRSYSARWELFIDIATECLDALLPTAASKNRNYILDQTNVYPSARQRKMEHFSGFHRIAAVLQPEIQQYEQRASRRTRETGKRIPSKALKKMKANFILPEPRDALFDRIDYIELDSERAHKLVIRFNRENI